MVPGSTQPLTEMSTRKIYWRVKAAGAYGWQPYHLHALTVLKSGSLKLLGPSGPVQACDWIALIFFTFLAVKTSFASKYQIIRHATGLVYLSIPVNALLLVKLYRFIKIYVAPLNFLSFSPLNNPTGQMEFPDNRFIRYQSAANIRRINHDVRHCLTKLKIHQHFQYCPPLIFTFARCVQRSLRNYVKKGTCIRSYLRKYYLSAMSSAVCTLYN